MCRLVHLTPYACSPVVDGSVVTVVVRECIVVLRHEHRHIIQTHLTSLSDSKTLEKTLLPYITNNIPHIMKPCCVDFIRPCGEVSVGCLQFEWFPIYVSVSFVVLCLTVLANCLLNAFAIWVGEVNVFSLKVMVLFWVVFLFIE